MTKPRVRLKADGTVVKLDGLQNLVANLGTERDKAAGSIYVQTVMDDQLLMNAYRGSWLARKIVDIPAFDACRNWRAWQADGEQIQLIEAEEKRLDIKRKVMEAKIAARLFGGAALLIGTGETNTAQPLNPERVKAGGLKYVTLLQRRHLSPFELETDPASPNFDMPRAWRLGSIMAHGGLEIHPSRLVMFRGAELPDRALAYHHVGWGDPVLQGVLDAVRNMDATAANVASLVFEAKVDTVGIPDFMARMAQGGPDYEASIIRRFALAERGKGINGTLIHDKDEVIGQKQATFSALPDVMDRFMQIASGAADIPMTRLMGQSPAGMNATGDSDMRNYYDRVSAMQSLELEPEMALLDECLIRSALGSRPEEVHFNWASLWQISEAERATIGKTQADTIKTLVDTALIPEEALAEAAVNLLTESGAMPGLEGAVQAYFEGNPEGEEAEPEDPEEPSEGEEVTA
jgi:phage-related protein (TIGR01555 family)